MEPLKLLLLDNDPITLDFLQDQFRRKNDEIHVCERPSALVQFFGKDLPDVVILAREWSENSLETLDLLKREWEELPVIFVSRNGSVAEVVQVMKKGARDYFLKPLGETGIEKSILQAAKDSKLLRKVNQLQEVHERRGQFDGLIGVSYTMQRIYRMIESVARGDATVMITGESGVGKELVAQAVHRRSLRRKNPFVAVNCANIPASLLESELFGHEKGAFTGADRRRIGCCEAAHTGTLFLDEICEMCPELQVKLLRFLEERNFRPLGGNRIVDVDSRVICATNRDPLVEIREGRLREDLYYRIAVIPLEVPPLRERKDDIPILAMKFLEEFSAKYEKYFYDFSADAMERLIEYGWPGNVRELKNTIEQIVALNTGSQVLPRFLPDRLLDATPKPKVQYIDSEDDGGNGVRKILRLHELEKQAILQALKICHGNIGEASRKLGLGQATLYRKIKKYGLRE
ncbi:MAG: sigma 54-interacting transcriptional regulator [Thermodesulfobacteriota bacterium]